MKGFDVLHVKSAVKSRNKFDLSRSHLTTMDFGQIVPLLVEETIPGDKFSIKGDYFSRMAPLVKPTYGKFNFKTVSAYVPYHQIAEDADAWLSGKTSWEGVTPHHRTFNFGEFLNFLAANANPGSATDYDFTYVNSSGTRQYRSFTTLGKYYYKVLTALGYSLPQNIDEQTGSVWLTTIRTIKLSAYPLLAFFKLYNDYMSMSQRFNTSPLSNFLNAVKYNRSGVTGYDSSSGAIDSTGLSTLFSNLYLCYDNDYFTSAWQNPNNPVSSIDYINSPAVPNTSGQSLGTAVADIYDNKLVTAVVSSVSTIGQRALDWLKSFDSWVRRNNYSGSRAVQQIYSRFGIKTDDYRTHYAHVIKTDSMPIQVGDVTATADATSVPLGDYAGKGIMNGSDGFSVQVDDYGMVLVLGYFTVVPMNSYGNFKHVLRNSPLDYYTPEFDGIGAQAISLSEIYTSPISTSTSTNDNQVFGFTERYNDYRYGRDVITGEFRDYRNAGDMNVWHTGRNLSALRDSNTLVAQSTSMNYLDRINSEYNRIFSITSGTVDHFYLTCRFNVDAMRPMLNLNQVVGLGTGDTTVPRNGNVIS